MNRLDLDPDLERLGEALHTSTTIDLAREHQAARASASEPRRARLRRPRLVAGGTLGLVGVGAALVLALGGTAATTPAFAITTSGDGVLVHLNYTTDQNLPQVDAKLASMGIHESVGIQMAPGAATVSGPVTCARGQVRTRRSRCSWAPTARRRSPPAVGWQHRRGLLPPGELLHLE